LPGITNSTLGLLAFAPGRAAANATDERRKRSTARPVRRQSF
jgi:hypothetical protein